MASVLVFGADLDLDQLPRVLIPRSLAAAAASTLRRATLNGSPVSAMRPRMLSFWLRLVTAVSSQRHCPRLAAQVLDRDD